MLTEKRKSPFFFFLPFSPFPSYKLKTQTSKKQKRHETKTYQFSVLEILSIQSSLPAPNGNIAGKGYLLALTVT